MGDLANGGILSCRRMRRRMIAPMRLRAPRVARRDNARATRRV
jgi:hypothetical protein